MTKLQEHYLHDLRPVRTEVLCDWKWGTWERWYYKTLSGPLALDFKFHTYEGVQGAVGPFIPGSPR